MRTGKRGSEQQTVMITITKMDYHHTLCLWLQHCGWKQSYVINHEHSDRLGFKTETADACEKCQCPLKNKLLHKPLVFM